MPNWLDPRMAGECKYPHNVGLHSPTRNTATSFLTATTKIYAIGAGITAAAGHYYQNKKRIYIEYISTSYSSRALDSGRLPYFSGPGLPGDWTIP